MTPGIRVHVVMPPSLVEGVDAARAEGQSRGDWVRRAVERALENGAERDLPSPAPAEQPEMTAEQAEIQGLRNLAESISKTPAYLSEAQLRERHGVEAVVPPDPKVGDEVPLRRVSPPKPVSPRVPFRRDVKPFQRGDK